MAFHYVQVDLAVGVACYNKIIIVPIIIHLLWLCCFESKVLKKDCFIRRVLLCSETLEHGSTKRSLESNANVVHHCIHFYCIALFMLYDLQL